MCVRPSTEDVVHHRTRRTDDDGRSISLPAIAGFVWLCPMLSNTMQLATNQFGHTVRPTPPAETAGHLAANTVGLALAVPTAGLSFVATMVCSLVYSTTANNMYNNAYRASLRSA